MDNMEKMFLTQINDLVEELRNVKATEIADIARVDARITRELESRIKDNKSPEAQAFDPSALEEELDALQVSVFI